MTKRFSALICGYGVPGDIATDPNYMAYLHAVVNRLFVDRRGESGTIVVSGGATDLVRPYRRTEAGEMAGWLKGKIGNLKIRKWKLIRDAKALTTVENLLNFVNVFDERGDVLIFCEATRAPRIRRLAREIPALRCAKIIAVDFDASPRRYNLDAIRKHEKVVLGLELPATKDPVALARVRKLAKEKLRLMRQYSPEEAHRRLPEIYARLLREEQS